MDADGDRAGECPYPGLNAFGPGQAKWFFGREAVTGELLRHLDAMTRGGPGGPLLGGGAVRDRQVLAAGRRAGAASDGGPDPRVQGAAILSCPALRLPGSGI